MTTRTTLIRRLRALRATIEKLADDPVLERETINGPSHARRAAREIEMIIDEAMAP